MVGVEGRDLGLDVAGLDVAVLGQGRAGADGVGPAGLGGFGDLGPGRGQDQVGHLLDADVGLGEAELAQVQAVVGLDAGNGDLRAGDGVALGVVVVFQVDPQALGAGGQVFPAGDQVASHGDAVHVLKVGVLLDIGIPIRGQRGLDDGHVKPGVVGDEGLAHQHGVQLLPDGEKVWGVHRVSGADAVDPDIAPLVFVSGGLDEPMGRGYHL